MYSLQKQICAGVLVSGILLTNLIPYGVMAEETIVSSESGATIVPEVAPENTGSEVIDTSISASGTEISTQEEVLPATEISTSGSENTGSIIASENIGEASGEILPETTNTSALLESSETDIGSLEIPEEVMSEKIQGMAEIAQSKIKTTDQNHDTESNSGEVYKSQEVLVQFKENLNIDSIMGAYQVERMVQSAGHEVKEIIPGTNIAVVGNVDISTNTFEKKDIASLFSTKNEDSTTEELITLYSKDPRVEQVQPNYKYELASIPNDPEFSNQWSLNNVGQTVNGITGTNNADINYPEAMDIFSGSSNSGTIVAVLDSGIEYDHPDFAGHLWDGTNCVSYTGANLGGCRYGYDFYMEDNDPYSNGIDHGSMVASIIGGVTNNGTGITGIAPNVKIMAVRVCSSVGCYTSDVIRGIQFAEKNGAKVINASFGGNRTMTGVSDYDWAYHDAIANFSGVFVTAAGNEASDNDIVYSFPGAFGQAITLSGEISSGGTIVYSGNVTIPALDNIISVAATDQNDGLANFSNYGSGSVDIGAPGTNILGTIGGGSVTSSGQISSASGWIRDGQSPAFWWEQIQSGAVIGTWADAGYPYASGATTNLTKTYNFPYTTTKTIGFNVWCDTPSSAQYTDYIQVEYSTGGTYAILRKIDEDILSLFGNTVVLGAHTGAIDTESFSITASGNVTVRLKWITDTIDQVDEAGQPHYGCLVYSDTLEYTSDRGATGKYDYMDGTSFASPMVAAAVALGMSYNPNVTPSLMKQIVLETGDALGSLSGVTRTGKRLNLENMLRAMQVPQVSSLTHTLDTYNSATISYALTNAATGTIFFGKNPALFTTDTGSVVYSGTNLSGSYMATNLESDTQYFYQVKTADGKYFSGTTSTTYSFTTPKVLEYTETGMVNTSGSIYLSGSTSTGVTYANNESGSLILANTGNTFSLTIPLSGSTLTPVASGWNGLMGNVTQKQANTVITMADSTQISVHSIYGILGGSGYTLSGNTSTLNISLPSDNGASISIYESLDGSTYALAGTCTVGGGNCTISSLASLGNWAIGYPVYPVISTPISGTTTGGGGGGGSASSASSSSSSASSSSPFLYTNKTLLETLWDTKNGVMSSNTPIRGTINFLNRTSIMENIRQNSDITLDLINYLETDGLARGKKLILLDINIHVLQSKLNKDTLESTEKKNLIINLQKLNQRKIKLIRTEFQF